MPSFASFVMRGFSKGESVPDYFIIEHPTKGTVQDKDWDVDGWKFKWGWSGPRSEAKRYTTLDAAKQDFILLPPKVQQQAYILDSADWSVAN
jgi:hypothetical protein